MKKIFLIIIFIFGLSKLNAQIHEIGVFGGGSNYVGDVGKTNYIDPNQIAYGIVYKWNKSPRHAWRFSYMTGKIEGNDLKSKEPARQKRDYNFKNNISEFSGGLEFNFFDFNLHEFGFKITPYVYSGISYFSYNELHILNGVAKTDDKKNGIAIPMVVGVKANVTEHLLLALEVGPRVTFTDNLDGSNPKSESYNYLKFGNLNSNDWYVFSGLSLTYTFGRKSCYCKQ